MQAPVRVLAAIRPSASAGVLAASAAQAAVFAATPFLVPEVVDRFDVALGFAALISTAQVGGFAVASWLAGRFLEPTARLVRVSMWVLVAANVASAWPAGFVALVLARTVAGAAMGAVTWVAWCDGVKDRRRLGEVAAIGPLVAVAAAPVLGWMAHAHGLGATYVTLAVVSAVAIPLPVRVSPPEPAPQQATGPRAGARGRSVLALAALCTLTVAGSSVFILAGSLPDAGRGVGAGAVAVGYSLNAAAGIVPARWSGRRPWPGAWLALTGLSAVLVGLASSDVMLIAGMVLWGATFWVGVPGVLSLLAAHLDDPDARVGEAHAAMSFGRVIGPMVGGVLVASGSWTTLGLTAGAMIVAAGVTLLVVERRLLGQRRVWAPRRSTASAISAVSPAKENRTNR